MVVYLANAFSLSMLPATSKEMIIKIRTLSVTEVKEILSQEEFVSAIGHETTASYLSKLLGQEIPTRRIQITLKPGDSLMVFQLMQRLPEGKVLTEEELSRIPYQFYLVHVVTA
ncbi:MAG: DUF1874 domain-containing protein [Nitrososphaerota archaeon]